jgi:type IV pilus secretin PilQ/predicted competence protein
MRLMPHSERPRQAARMVLVTALALASSLSLTAGTVPIRLLGVSGQGNAVFIESAEPAGYVVKRPDPLTILVELRNVSIGNAANLVARRDPIASVTLEQASGDDGRALARVRVSLGRPAEFAARSIRNTIRLDLTPVDASTLQPDGTLARTAQAIGGPGAESPAATILDRVLSSRTEAATTVTLSGNGRLTPAGVSEAGTEPRRLVLDFPQVAPRAPAQTHVEGALVTRVRVALNSREPLLTRVVMEVAPGATYHVERAGTAGRDLAVVFEPPQAAASFLLAPAEARAAALDPEPDIPLEQAIANAASITPRDPDPVAALALAPVRPVPALRSTPRAAARPSAATAAVARLRSQGGTAAVPAEPPNTPVLLGGADKKYSGNPITLDFNGIDLRTVLRYFNEISGLNIIIDPSVPSTPIDVVMRDVPWDQAFETLLRAYKLGYTAEGTIVRIAPISVLAEEEGDRRKLSEAKALAGDLRVQTFSLSYAKAADLQSLLTRSALSARGQIQVDTRTNTVIMTDLPDRLATAQALIGTLDRPEPQVEVEARVVQTTREFAKALGVQWGLNGRATPAIGNTTGLAFPNNILLGGRALATPNDPRAAGDPIGRVVDLPVAGPTGAIGVALGAINGALNLDLALSALEHSGKGRILSTPRLTTQNNVSAEVAQGIQIPIQTVANNTTTVTFKDAVLKLQVTPQITSANTVIMQITLENSTADFSRVNQVTGLPPITTQRAQTQVQVDDGATTIIGGIFVSTESSATDRTPLLYRLPLLGWLFKRDDVRDSSQELLIFITPRILKG